jgi:site-specific recombinase XerD
MGFYVYTNSIHQYSSRVNFTPDQIIADVKCDEPKEYAGRVKKHRRFLQDCLDELDDDGRSPGRLHAYAKHIRTFYRVNEVEIPRPDLPRPMVVRKDRAPKPEELQRLLEIADLREKVIVSMLALGAFREGTLVRLQYRHIKEDLEKGLTLIHVHVEPEITKGKYHDYDTFLGPEAVEALKLYLNARKRGLIDRRIPAEEITDNSWLIRDHQKKEPRPIGEKQLYKLIHDLYSRLGLLKQGQNGGYDLRVHSLRKFFKTQLMAQGVQSDYIDYMMGHTIDTYHDIQSKGVEFLRNTYARADLRIKPKPSISKNEVVIQAIRGMLTPRQLQRVEEALTEPDTKYLDAEERQREEIHVLSRALRDSLKRELLSGT